MKTLIRKHRRMAGISMVEALVALVVISIGMLGIAGLYLSSLQASRSANLRVQAVNLSSDLADRIRANKSGRENYNALATDNGVAHACAVASCSGKDIAENDLFVWKQGITAALPANANGSVAFTDNTALALPNSYAIRVTWREAGADVDSTYTMTVEL